jgi:hypothetical protein
VATSWLYAEGTELPTIRIRPLWRNLALIAFAGFSMWSSSIHLTRKEISGAENEDVDSASMYDHVRGEPMSPWVAGFATGCLVCVFLYLTTNDDAEQPKQPEGIDPQN